MLKPAYISALTLLAALAVAGAPCLAQGQAASGSSSVSAASSPPAGSAPVVLDRVVAVINGDVILESDVENEMRFAVLQPGRANPGQNTQQNALRRLIDRDLILQQMKATRIVNRQASAEEIHSQIESLRKSIPECAQYHCVEQAGWNAFLAAHDLTEDQIEARWRQRIMILAFIQTRFGAGVRISEADIDQYYRQDLVSEFAKRHLQPPPLESVSARIREILLQQHVNVLLQEWLQSLKEEGSVSILSPAYAQVGSAEGSASGPKAEAGAKPGAEP